MSSPEFDEVVDVCGASADQVSRVDPQPSTSDARKHTSENEPKDLSAKLTRKEEHFTLIQKGGSLVKKYNAQQTVWQARLNPQRDGDLISGALGALSTMIQKLISETTVGLQSSDRARAILFSDALDRPISTNLCSIKDFTPEKILTEVMRVLQSKKTISFDNTLRLDILTIKS